MTNIRQLKIDQDDPQLQGLSSPGRSGPGGPLRNTREQRAKKRIFIQSEGQDVDLTGCSLTTASGKADQDATGGTFTMTYGANTTPTPLAYNISAANLSTALNALASVTSAGGVTVSLIGNIYVIRFVTVGAKSVFSVDALLTTPPVAPSVQQYTVGDGSTKEVQLFNLSQAPFMFCDAFTLHTGGDITNTQIATGDFGSPAIYEFSFDPAPTGGAFLAECKVPEVTYLSFSGPTGASADGTWFALSDQVSDSPVGFWISDGTTTSPPAELLAVGVRQAIEITVAAGDTTSQVNDEIETVLLTWSASWAITSVSGTVPIILVNMFEGERTPPSSDSSGLIGVSVLQAGFSVSGFIQIGSSEAAIETALANKFTVTISENNSMTLVANTNGELPIFILDETGVEYPDYFEGTEVYDTLAIEYGLQGVADDVQFIDATYEVQLTRSGEEPDTILQYPQELYRNITRSGGNYYAPGSTSGNPILTGKQLWVDSVNGNDSTGVSGRFDFPFATIAAAETAAASGDTINIRPGASYVGNDLGKDNVTYNAIGEVTISAATLCNFGVFSTKTTDINFRITGFPNLVDNAASGTRGVGLHSDHASGGIYAEIGNVSVGSGGGDLNVGVYLQNGTNTVISRGLIQSAAYDAIILEGGSNTLDINRAYSAADGNALELTGGTSMVRAFRADTDGADDAGFSAAAIFIGGGTHDVEVREAKATLGVALGTSGTTAAKIIFKGRLVAPATNAVRYASGTTTKTVVLDHATLIANGSADAIEAPGAQTVLSYYSVRNRPNDGNITVTGTMQESSAFV